MLGHQESYWFSRTLRSAIFLIDLHRSPKRVSQLSGLRRQSGRWTLVFPPLLYWLGFLSNLPKKRIFEAKFLTKFSVSNKAVFWGNDGGPV